MPPQSSALFAALLCAVALPDPCASQRPATGVQPVYIDVRLPDAAAKLDIDGVPTQQKGARRYFVSPPLDPCQSYSYTLTVKWDPNGYSTITRTRTVAVRAGQRMEVDLSAPGPQPLDKIVAIYVPTPEEVVTAMLKLAKVGKDDIVYDLGCGDGRLVIEAVKKFGARRGVGVDIDPERIKESRQNAREQGVTDKVEFRRDDVSNIKDLSDATVVVLYLGDDLNQRLRPVLQKSLKPGSRIVSHLFLMGDWKPVKTETIPVGDGLLTPAYPIHLWIIGAGPRR
jgi:uncharacterized protein (TIGR03000 family)